MRILAIETSCDETSIAIAEFYEKKSAPQVRVFSHIVLSQISLHKKFGGVVPNLAKREHQRNLAPILLRVLKEAKLSVSSIKNQVLRNDESKSLNTKYSILNTILEREPELFKQFLKKIFPLGPPPIDAIAVTYGPGLAPALWVGVNFAKALAYLWDKPLIPVNHMAGHLYSAILQKSGIENSKHEARNSKQILNSKSQIPNDFEFRISDLEFPAIALLVSGGHTELVFMRGHGKFKVIGETLDDAAGEAFDKVARLLGLSYPGGPEISKLAEMKSYEVQPHKISLPRPMLNSGDYNFSFSGLKTAVLYLTRELGMGNPSTSSGSIRKRIEKLRPLIAKEFQDAVVEVLVKKTIRAAKEYKIKTILLGGGVAANKLLREKLSEACKKELSGVICQMSDVAFAGDNAFMIAVAAYFTGKKKALDKVGADANSRLS